MVEHEKPSEEKEESIADFWITRIIIIGVSMITIWLVITLMGRAILVNFDACTEIQSLHDCFYVHPHYYTIPEILHMQWDWVVAHRVI